MYFSHLLQIGELELSVPMQFLQLECRIQWILKNILELMVYLHSVESSD